MKPMLMVLGVVTLAACSPTVPDSGAPAGVGFEGYGDYSNYRSARDEALSTGTPLSATAPAAGLPASTNATGAPLAADGQDVVEMAPRTVAGPVDPNNTRISDEQDFNAVANRQSIESDAQRLARQRAAYKVIEPTAVPARTGDSGPNIVKYALSTTHPRGQKVYRRSSVAAAARFERNCGKFNSDDLAQEAFLEAGGPERDRSGLDPDGDGYACNWDPSPFRQLRS